MRWRSQFLVNVVLCGFVAFICGLGILLVVGPTRSQGDAWLRQLLWMPALLAGATAAIAAGAQWVVARIRLRR